MRTKRRTARAPVRSCRFRHEAAVARMRGKNGERREEEHERVFLPLLLVMAFREEEEDEDEKEEEGKKRRRTRVHEEKNAAARSSLCTCKKEGMREGGAIWRRRWAARWERVR